MIRLYLWFCRVHFFCTRTMGAVGTRPSLRPLLLRGRNESKSSDAICAARTLRCVDVVAVGVMAVDVMAMAETW
jgi:hypothetical protein